jgi:hypothetical protein
MELGQLQGACAMLRRFEGVEPEEILPAALPPIPVRFEQNVEYVREVLATQVDLRTDGPDYVEVGDLPSGHRLFEYQELVNAGGTPSEIVIEQARNNGGEYRSELAGEHPVKELRRDPAQAR